jgi:hypothetical protein
MGTCPKTPKIGIYWWVDCILTPLYCSQNFGGQVALPLLFSTEISGDKAYKLARQAAVEP